MARTLRQQLDAEIDRAQTIDTGDAWEDLVLETVRIGLALARWQRAINAYGAAVRVRDVDQGLQT